MAFYKRSRVKDAAFRRLIPLLLVALLLVFLLVFTVRMAGVADVMFASRDVLDESVPGDDSDVVFDVKGEVRLPKQTELSLSLEERNHLPPRNLDLFPKLAKGHIKIALYVHNRPQYLQVVVNSLSKVKGIEETLLIVSHDGYFEEMDKIVKAIKFCQVKQIYAPYSPHLFPDSFPGVSPGDCSEKDDPSRKKCKGIADQYGSHRSPKIVSLKHHWWWMMNTVWDGLEESRGYSGHILFIEEDHFIFPNAYRNIQLLTQLKPRKCPHCYAANLAPSDVKLRGEGWESLIAEKIGNVGYAFNRTVWQKFHSKARRFCSFDDYNWDITMWATVYPSLGTPVYTLRGPRRSAAHFGKCGLHQGQGRSNACIDNGVASFEVEEIDRIPNIQSSWNVHVLKSQGGYGAGFKGWGGWGDKRDHELCLSFAYMYHNATTSLC
uniref:Alpha-1,6-mannosyl-glycoprotein 2-beta-N-acetylglucosaminyltransferase n=1 Tax=Anthurium amnicola TaxID=1678845 RepID=A0A1D1YVR3_9ARAE